MSGKEDTGTMGGRRRSLVAGLAFLMFMGTAVYFRLWAIDYNVSSDDTELLRFVFFINLLSTLSFRNRLTTRVYIRSDHQFNSALLSVRSVGKYQC